MAVNNCVKYLLFFFNLLFWVSLLLPPVATACSGSVGSDLQNLRASPPNAGPKQAASGWLLLG